MLMEMSLCFFHLVLKQVNETRTNETRHIEWHKTCKRKCKFGANVCNNKQRWNKDKRRCECKELIDKGLCNKGFIWNPSNCECECDKASDVGEYLDYENCKCRKKLVDQLVDECTETIEEVKIAKITLAENENSYKCSSCTVYIMLMIVVFTIVPDLVLILFITTGLWLKLFRALSLLPVLKQRFNKLTNGKN